MSEKEQIEVLKGLCIFLAKTYQTNYETYCSASNVDYRKDITDERKEEFFDYMHSFSSIQGFSQRQFIKGLSERENTGLSFEKIEEVFQSDSTQQNNHTIEPISE